MTAGGWIADVAQSAQAKHSAVMSIYRKSVRFMLWVLFLFVTFPVWIGFLEANFGMAAVFAWQAFLFGHGLVVLFVLTCPNCRRSLFVGKLWLRAWPAKTCSKCGHDLTNANHQPG